MPLDLKEYPDDLDGAIDPEYAEQCEQEWRDTLPDAVTLVEQNGAVRMEELGGCLNDEQRAWCEGLSTYEEEELAERMKYAEVSGYITDAAFIQGIAYELDYEDHRYLADVIRMHGGISPDGQLRDRADDDREQDELSLPKSVGTRRVVTQILGSGSRRTSYRAKNHGNGTVDTGGSHGSNGKSHSKKNGSPRIMYGARKGEVDGDKGDKRAMVRVSKTPQSSQVLTSSSLSPTKEMQSVQFEALLRQKFARLKLILTALVFGRR